MFDFGVKDVIDILIVATILFYVYKIMKESGTLSIFFGVLAFIVAWLSRRFSCRWNLPAGFWTNS